MSTSRAKQISQRKKSKTKKNGNGSRNDWAKPKKMRQGPRHMWGANPSSKRRK